MAPSQLIRKASQKPFNEEPKFDTSSGEEEEVKFNLKPRGVRAQGPERKLGEGVAFHSKQVAASKARTKPREINWSDSEEEVIFNFNPNNLPQIQITEIISGESSEESDDTASKEETGRDRQLWEEESDEEIIYHVLKKPYKGLEIDNESEESFMINMGLDNGRDNLVKPSLVNKERSWRKFFEARIWSAINETRHQIENNRREVSKQWEIMQDIKTQHNEIMVMIENLQTTIYNSGLLKEVASQPRFGTPEKQTPASGKWAIIVVNETGKEETNT
jgi:hypothetical protein